MNTWQYIKSDYLRYYGTYHSAARIISAAIFSRNHCFQFSFWLRLAKKRGILGRFAKVMHHHYSIKYGIQIPWATKIGYGLYIGHGVGIVVNPGTVIGNNCNLSQFLSIGSNHNTPAVIGDNVYIGPHVSIVEDVHIGANVVIGAGSVVVKDIPENSTVVGNPARVIGFNKHPEYISNKYAVNPNS